jgi:hypothetical protein
MLPMRMLERKGSNSSQDTPLQNLTKPVRFETRFRNIYPISSIYPNLVPLVQNITVLRNKILPRGLLVEDSSIPLQPTHPNLNRLPVEDLQYSMCQANIPRMLGQQRFLCISTLPSIYHHLTRVNSSRRLAPDPSNPSTSLGTCTRLII